MKFAEFREHIKRTLPQLGTQLQDSVHMSMGFTSELPELLLALHRKDLINVGEELADAAWYAGNYATVNGIDLGDFEFSPRHVAVRFPGMEDDDEMGEQMMLFMGELLDMDKKWLAYGRLRDLGKAREMLLGLLNCIGNCAARLGVSMEEAMARNVEKLRVRYPEKFDAARAVHRDLEREREALEGAA